MTTNKGRWRQWYQLLNEGDDPQPYGDDASYRILANWGADCHLVEDWGCGKGYMRNFIDDDRYLGIDGTPSPFADIVADLAAPRGVPPRGLPEGVVMRHVIEHDRNWNEILRNLASGFSRRCAIAVFTPMTGEPTTEIAFNSEIGIPDISFNPPDITCHFRGCSIQCRHIESNTQYGEETIFLIERPSTDG
jgi:hypothetical protein